MCLRLKRVIIIIALVYGKKMIEIPTFSIELLRFCPFYKVIHDTSDQYDFNNGVHADENLIWTHGR